MEKTLLTGLAALLIGTGCATTMPTTKLERQESQTAQEREYATLQEAKEVLGIPSASMITHINGYKMPMGTNMNISSLAGLLAGTVKLESDTTETDQGYVINTHFNGGYSQFMHPEAMKKVLERADTNKDMIITHQEETDLTIKMIEEYSKNSR